MMNTHYVFDTEAQAIAAEAQIISNVMAWVQAHSPAALVDGKLRGRNAKTGELTNVYTERWAVPRQNALGKWVFPKPTQADAGIMPLATMVQGVSAVEADFDPSWFPI